MVKVVKNPLKAGTIVNYWKIIKFISASDSEDKKSLYICECILCQSQHKVPHKNLTTNRSTKCKSCSAKYCNPKNPTGKGGYAKKLFPEQIKEIVQSTEKYRILAEKFEVTVSAISNIKRKNGIRKYNRRKEP